MGKESENYPLKMMQKTFLSKRSIEADGSSHDEIFKEKRWGKRCTFPTIL